MEGIKISDIVAIVNGKANYKDNISVTGVETDSRRIKSGDMYVAIIGAKVDGHTFIQNAYEAGASCALVSKYVDNSPMPIILVDSTEDALRKLAKAYFEKLSPKTVAVTGSCGKTTTKELLYEVFSVKYNTLKTNGNYNSTIGLPLTVCRLKNSHEAAILEMGTGHKGEIACMCEVVKPDIAVITNIGTSHIEFFGSREAIGNEKCDLFRAVKHGGTLVINNDDDILSHAVELYGLSENIITFAIENDADITAKNIETLSDNNNFRTRFDIIYKDKIVNATINTLGIHNVYNSLAALAAGIADGISLEAAAKALSNFIPDDMRMKVFKCRDGVTVISDIYNSNPQAVEASLKVLYEMDSGRKICILGDMLEQGSFSRESHIHIGKLSAKYASFLISRGNMAQYIAEGAAEQLPYKNIRAEKTNKDVIDFLSAFEFKKDDVILVKGSRGMKMEEITNFIINDRFDGQKLN